MRAQRQINALLVIVLLLALFFSVGCGPSARLVIGQPDFISHMANQNREMANNTLFLPGGPVAIDRDTLYVADSSNNRILKFSPIPAHNNPSATGIIQSVDPAKWLNFSDPYGVSIANGKMFIPDDENGRVLIWNAIPTANEGPDVVLGQSDLTSPPVRDCSHMNGVMALFATDDKLVVSDLQNNRILIWNTIPSQADPKNPVSADLILGNADCSADTAGATRHTFNQPRGVWTDGTKLVVADNENHRVLIWLHFPKSSSDDADIVLGTGKPGSGQNQMNKPYAVTSDGARLFVAEQNNHRVLIWNRFPSKDGDLPDAVLGQKDFIHAGRNGALLSGDMGSPSGNSMSSPQGLYYHDDKLWVTDTGNHRVLLFDMKK